MSRPSIHAWAYKIAQATAERATCPQRQVGCVLLDADKYILATGYNGAPKGVGHCYKCTNETCVAVHAEVNAIEQLKRHNIDPGLVHACYVTLSPCKNCLNKLFETGCRHIYYGLGHRTLGDCQSVWRRGVFMQAELADNLAKAGT